MSWPNHLTKLSNESYKHFVAKAILFWILRDQGHEVSSEWRVPNGYVDLCDKTTRTLYEIELASSKVYRDRKIAQYRITGYEIIIVDCSEMPDDVEELRTFLEQYVVPD